MGEKMIFISWQPYCSRSDHIARELGGESYKIYYDFFGSRYSTVIFKYIFQSLKTIWILLKKRPKAVFVMSPPVFANIPVFIYSKLFKAKYIIDAHTGAFVDVQWQKVQKLQKFFAQQAELVSVTNAALQQKVQEWRANTLIIPDVPVLVSNMKKLELTNNMNIVLVNTFAKDEPLDNFLEAAHRFPEVSFYITGKLYNNSKYKSHAFKNITFTDFLPDSEFYGLLAAADLVAVLTTRDNTMQRGAYEAVYVGTPVLTSDWNVLRRNFPKGAVFVDNSVESIAQGFDIAIRTREKLKKEVMDLKEEKIIHWNEIKNELLKMI